MQTGLFGKLPAHGDFVTRGLAGPDRKALDRWLTQNIGQMTLPVDGLRLRWSLGGNRRLAVIHASHDRSTRVFPIVAVCADLGWDQQTADSWCCAAAEVLTNAVLSNWGAEATVSALPPPMAAPKHPSPAADVMWAPGDEPRPVAEALSALSSD